MSRSRQQPSHVRHFASSSRGLRHDSKDQAPTPFRTHPPSPLGEKAWLSIDLTLFGDLEKQRNRAREIKLIRISNIPSPRQNKSTPILIRMSQATIRPAPRSEQILSRISQAPRRPASSSEVGADPRDEKSSGKVCSCATLCSECKVLALSAKAFLF